MPSTHNTPLYTCFSSYNSHPTQCQSSKNNKHPKQRTASLNPSLRLRGLAQARRARSGEPPPLSPGRGFDGALRKHHGISLKRDPSRLGEVFPRSRVQAGRLGDLSCNSPGRAPCFISPRRDWLAWARFTGLATVLHCNSHVYQINQT